MLRNSPACLERNDELYIVKGGVHSFYSWLGCKWFFFFLCLSFLWNLKRNKISTLFICCWIPDVNRYEVIEVKDSTKNELHKQDKVFGCGSSDVLRELRRLKTT